ncbi:pilus assembly protein [Kerstersia gyiorum]|nr:pilus assembly protein [Kerstersia gyiorum]
MRQYSMSSVRQSCHSGNYAGRALAAAGESGADCRPRSCLPGAGARKQCGAYAVEFAFTFVIFFMVLYGIIVYGLIYVTQQSLNLAAQDVARYALRWPGAVAGNELQARAQNALAMLDSAETLAWLQERGTGADDPLNIAICGLVPGGAGQLQKLAGTAHGSCPQSTVLQPSQLEVVVSYDWKKSPLAPDLSMGLIALVAPERLAGYASTRVQLDSQKAGG